MHWFWYLLLSDVLVFFSFPPFSLGPVMFIGLVPLFVVLERCTSWKQAFLRTWLFVVIGNTAICFWVGPTIQEFAKVSAWVSYPSVVLLSLFEQSAWPVMAALRHAMHRKFGARPLLWTPACLVALDYIWPKFFPNSLGNVLYSVPWLSQFADFTGVWGLTAVLVVSNEIVALWFAKTWSRSELRKHSLCSLAVLTFVFSYSGIRYYQMQNLKKASSESLRVALIQPNINPIALVREASDKHAARYKYALPLFELSKQSLAQNPELIFWPETSVSNTYASGDSRETLAVTQAIDDFVRSSQVPLLFGARDRRGDDLYNALFLVSPEKSSLSVQRYYKSRLLWLGEYLPFSTLFPAIADHVRKQGGTTFTPGAGAMSFHLGKYHLAPMICLEGLYSDYVRELARTGAQVLVNATNDAWFGQGMEPPLHLYLTAFRSIETRRPLIRATTTGHSAVVDIDGQLKLKSDLGDYAYYVQDVPIYPEIFSPYLFWGPTPIALAFLWACFCFFVSRRRSMQLSK